MKISIIGRPNVGKSTLFNRLAGSKLAIVGDMPGVTRDRKYASANLFGLNLQILDTPGVDPFSKNNSLAEGMNNQSFAAIKEADVVLFMVDAVDGITEYDKAIAEWVRSALKKTGNRPIILVKNKCEGKIVEDNFRSLGFGEGIAISAEHNLGIDELYEAICSFEIDGDDGEQNESSTTDTAVKIAIVGRPNVGKSTMINAIISEDRLLTGDQAGITRDAISVDYIFKGRKFSIIDTAGQRKKSKVNEKIEETAVLDAWRYIKQANVVVAVMDIKNPFEKQDITIARKAFDEGKVVIFAINKSDTVENPEKVAKEIEERATKEFAQLPGAKCLLVSAKEKKGLARIFNVALELVDKWSVRITTAQLNKWFAAAIAKNPPPLVNGLPIKLKYISQTNTKPPTFVIFANRAEHLPKSYERYLLNQLRESFKLAGIPLRLFVRQRENPHV